MAMCFFLIIFKIAPKDDKNKQVQHGFGGINLVASNILEIGYFIGGYVCGSHILSKKTSLCCRKRDHKFWMYPQRLGNDGEWDFFVLFCFKPILLQKLQFSWQRGTDSHSNWQGIVLLKFGGGKLYQLCSVIRLYL